MNACPALTGEGAASIATALRGVDCATGQATAAAFGRLFGADGRLVPALTILLTLYVGLFAIGLLTGRTRIGVAALTPRMMTLGLVLTFATSWVAYQNVVWTLATGAPDQIASIVAGTRGSATTAFADRLDGLFTAVADAADQAAKPAAPTDTGITPATPMVGGFTASTVLWLSALMLLLGTVGVLVTAKIALAAMLALGPLFIVLALFRGTRGLFEGWLKAVVLAALIPLLAVLIGGGAIAALDPIARSIALEGADPSTRAVGVLFLGACVYIALMAMAVKTATMLVSGWRLPGDHAPAGDAARADAAGSSAPGAPRVPVDARIVAIGGDDRVRGIVGALPASSASFSASAAREIVRIAGPTSARVVTLDGSPYVAPRADPRALGLGSRFRPRPAAFSREQRS